MFPQVVESQLLTLLWAITRSSVQEARTITIHSRSWMEFSQCSTLPSSRPTSMETIRPMSRFFGPPMALGIFKGKDLVSLVKMVTSMCLPITMAMGKRTLQSFVHQTAPGIYKGRDRFHMGKLEIFRS